MARINKLGTPYLGLPTLEPDEVKRIKRYLKWRKLSAKAYLVYLLRKQREEMEKFIADQNNKPQ